MSNRIALFFLLLFFGMAQAQQLNCTVTVNSEKISNANPNTFKTLEKSISEFVNKTDWIGSDFKQSEMINCSMYITLNTYDSNQYSATIQVQSSRPVYNSTYTTPVVNINDKDFNFSYVEFENLIYDPTNFSSNLVSVLSFYSFVIIGMDADTFGDKGGSPFLETAQEICIVAQQGGSKGWALSDGTQNRYFLINDMLSATYSPFREAMFQYHYDGLDNMANDLKTAKQNIVASIKTLSKLYSVRPNAYLTRVFFDAKADEIVSIFSGGPSVSVTELADSLNKLSPLNSSKWGALK
jgi:hypothetical protein